MAGRACCKCTKERWARGELPPFFHAFALPSDGAGGLVPWVATTTTIQNVFVQSSFNGGCSNTGDVLSLYPAEQLMDRFGNLVDDINDLYVPPFKVLPVPTP